MYHNPKCWTVTSALANVDSQNIMKYTPVHSSGERRQRQIQMSTTRTSSDLWRRATLPRKKEWLQNYSLKIWQTILFDMFFGDVAETFISFMFRRHSQKLLSQSCGTIVLMINFWLLGWPHSLTIIVTQQFSSTWSWRTAGWSRGDWARSTSSLLYRCSTGQDCLCLCLTMVCNVLDLPRGSVPACLQS